MNPSPLEAPMHKVMAKVEAMKGGHGHCRRQTVLDTSDTIKLQEKSTYEGT